LYSSRTWYLSVYLHVCLSVCRFASVCSVHHFVGGPVERSDSGVYLSTVCLSVCVLVHHLGEDLVQQSDGGVCLPILLSVCLSLLGTSFRWSVCAWYII